MAPDKVGGSLNVEEREWRPSQRLVKRTTHWTGAADAISLRMNGSAGTTCDQESRIPLLEAEVPVQRNGRSITF